MINQIIELATAKSAADLATAVDVSLLKKVQQMGAAETLQLLQDIPVAPSLSGMGDSVDVSA